MAPLSETGLLLHVSALLRRFVGSPLRVRPGAAFNLATIVLAALIIALGWELLTIQRVRFDLKLIAIAAPSAERGSHRCFISSRLLSRRTFRAPRRQGTPYGRIRGSSAGLRRPLHPTPGNHFWRNTPVNPATIETFGFQFPLGGLSRRTVGFSVRVLGAHNDCCPSAILT